MPGTIEKAVMSGSDNPSLYMRRFPAEERKAGGYRLQDTPHELAQAVSVIRSHSAPKYVICFGVETGGSERFLMEECGAIAYSTDRPFPAENRQAMESRGIREIPFKEGADVILIRGGDYWKEAMRWCKRGTLVCVHGTLYDPSRGLEGAARKSWNHLRSMYGKLKQPQDGGIGISRIENMIEINEAKKGAGNADEIEETKSVDAREQAGDGEAVGEGDTERQEAPEAGQEVKRWATNHDACVMCGKTDKAHTAKGYCRGCYPKRGKA